MGILNTVSKAAQEDCRLTDDFVCKGTTSFSQSDKRSLTRTGRETGSRLGHITSKEMGTKFEPSRTRPFEKTPKEERLEDARANRMQDGAKDSEVLTPPRKHMKEVDQEMPIRHPKSAANEVPANHEGGKCISAIESTTARKTVTFG